MAFVVGRCVFEFFSNLHHFMSLAEAFEVAGLNNYDPGPNLKVAFLKRNIGDPVSESDPVLQALGTHFSIQF